jgi:ABC-type xylose transport system substrate-binding protein
MEQILTASDNEDAVVASNDVFTASGVVAALAAQGLDKNRPRVWSGR